MKFKLKNSFTMAEVLITLGIIGIITAMTLPSLIGNYKRKVLETQFKKSVSVISQVILNTKNDLSIDKLADFCTTYNYEDSKYSYQNICYDAYYKNFLELGGRKSWGSANFNIHRQSEKILTYNRRQIVTTDDLAGIGSPIFNTNIMPDGSFINMWIDEFTFYISVDTNGQRGPNQLGHDIFVFSLDKRNDMLSYPDKPKYYTDEEIDKDEYDYGYQKARKGNPCNFFSNQKANGIGCAWYALRDECPDESGRHYFECLP